MVHGDYSLALEAQKMFLLVENSSTYRIWWPLMHALSKLRKFWIGDSFPWKTNLQKLQPLLEHGKLQKEQQRKNSSIQVCNFGMGDVKEGGNHMIYALYDRSSAVSLWRIDPFQLLVNYSKDIFTCMILDDQLLEEGYSVKDGVIYY